MVHDMPSREKFKNVTKETSDGAVSTREAAQRLLATLAPLNGANDEIGHHPSVDRSIGTVSCYFTDAYIILLYTCIIFKGFRILLKY